MSGPYCGRRVKIHGLQSKPELNGMVGVATIYDDSKNRYTVQLSSGPIALQPKNLEPVNDDSSSNFGGGANMRGGMPNFGNMPGGLPDFLSIMAQLGLPGVQPMHIAAAFGAAFYLIFYASWILVGLIAALIALAFFTHRSSFEARGGGVRGLLAAVQDATSQLAVKASAMSGKPVSKIHILGALAVLLYAVSYLLSSGPRGSAGTMGKDDESDFGLDLAIKPAYNAGYDDASANKVRDPDNYLFEYPAPAFHSQAPPSKMGVGSVINMMIIASMLYGMGGSPWSLKRAIDNVRQNPMQLLMAVMMCSRMI